MKPIIGILPMINGENQSYIVQNYVDAIESSGAMAIMLPYTESCESIDRFLDISDGFLFAGGPDIEPYRYGEKKLDACEGTAPLRDAVELLAFPKIFATGKPVLGICRGLQLINTALGGTLYQDMPSQIESGVKHRNKDVPSFHDINISDSTPLKELSDSDHVTVNSYHHQAIKDIGRELEVMARGDDGVIEAVYIPGRKFFWAFQWHPEKNMENELNKRIFKAFVEATK